jgi:RNA polymerase sigma-70 factor (ECF subfamily)
MEHVLEIGRVLPAGDLLTIPARTAALGATIRAVAAGDQDAFARLYADYVRMVHAILLGCVPRRDVDDLVQEVFLAAYTRIRKLREPVAFGGWIATIARNRATDYLRRRASRSSCRTSCPAAIRSTPTPSPSSTSSASCPRRIATHC